MSMETRFPCPVCLGVKMEKVILETDAPPQQRRGIAAARAAQEKLVLDHCARCGGVWFEAGEVQRLRRCESELLWKEIVRREEAAPMMCHSCRSPLSRDAEKCAVCNWVVELDCPTCTRPLDVSVQSDLRLDYCRHCKGVWFDHTELASIWRLELDAALARRRRSGTDVGDVILIDALLFDPFLMYYGLNAGMHVAGAAAHGLANVAGGSGEAIASVAGAAGEAASGLFETIVEIISGIFG